MQAFEVVPIRFWSRGSASRSGDALKQAAELRDPEVLAFESGGRFYAGQLSVCAGGVLRVAFNSARPIRLWFNGQLVLDEPLSMRSYQREVVGVFVLPVEAGEQELRVEVGALRYYPSFMDDYAPSRNRKATCERIAVLHPDALQLRATFLAQGRSPAVSLCFGPAQFMREGAVWQHLLARPIPGFREEPPSAEQRCAAEVPPAEWILRTDVQPCVAEECTSPEEWCAGLQHFRVPVVEAGASVAPLRPALYTHL